MSLMDVLKARESMEVEAIASGFDAGGYVSAEKAQELLDGRGQKTAPWYVRSAGWVHNTAGNQATKVTHAPSRDGAIPRGEAMLMLFAPDLARTVVMLRAKVAEQEAELRHLRTERTGEVL